MATVFADNALREFNIALDELTSSLEFVRVSAKLRPRLNELVRWEGLEPEASVLVRQYINQKSFEAAPLYRGAVIVLSGAFEHLVRRLVHEFVVRINESVAMYDLLADKIKIQNTLRTGHALITIGQPLDHLDMDYFELSKNIGTCRPGIAEFVLNANAFTTALSSISPKHLEEILKRIDVELSWDDFGKDSALRQMFNEKDTRRTAKAVQAHLEKFVRTRNRLAHTGSGGIIITDDQLDDYLQFFRLFAKRLVEVLKQRLPKELKAKQ